MFIGFEVELIVLLLVCGDEVLARLEFPIIRLVVLHLGSDLVCVGRHLIFEFRKDVVGETDGFLELVVLTLVELEEGIKLFGLLFNFVGVGVSAKFSSFFGEKHFLGVLGGGYFLLEFYLYIQLSYLISTFQPYNTPPSY